MPPKTTRNFSVGDLVFAKIKGYPPWPARIEEEFPAGYKTYPGRYPVFFYGTYEVAVVSSKDIYPYEQFKQQYGIQRKLKNFNEALNEIENDPDISKEIADARSKPETHYTDSDEENLRLNRQIEEESKLYQTKRIQSAKRILFNNNNNNNKSGKKSEKKKEKENLVNDNDITDSDDVNEMNKINEMIADIKKNKDNNENNDDNDDNDTSTIESCDGISYMIKCPKKRKPLKKRRKTITIIRASPYPLFKEDKRRKKRVKCPVFVRDSEVERTDSEVERSDSDYGRECPRSINEDKDVYGYREHPSSSESFAEMETRKRKRGLQKMPNKRGKSRNNNENFFEENIKIESPDEDDKTNIKKEYDYDYSDDSRRKRIKKEEILDNDIKVKVENEDFCIKNIKKCSDDEDDDDDSEDLDDSEDDEEEDDVGDDGDDEGNVCTENETEMNSIKIKEEIPDDDDNKQNIPLNLVKTDNVKTTKSHSDNNKTTKIKEEIEDELEDVEKLKQKLQDEKLAQKLAEKELEKERRKREKMEQKRLERLKRSQEINNQIINKLLITIDQNIKNSLSKNNANINKCLETMDNIFDIKEKITSKNLPNFSTNLKNLIQTLRKCRKYKLEERIQQKANFCLNSLKEFFTANESQQLNEIKFETNSSMENSNDTYKSPANDSSPTSNEREQSTDSDVYKQSSKVMPPDLENYDSNSSCI